MESLALLSGCENRSLEEVLELIPSTTGFASTGFVKEPELLQKDKIIALLKRKEPAEKIAEKLKVNLFLVEIFEDELKLEEKE